MVKCKSEDCVTVIFTNLEVRKSKQYINTLPKGNIDIIRKFDVQKKINGCSEKTRRNYIRLLLQFSKETGKSFNITTSDDINAFLALRDGSTLQQYLMDIKHFFKWFGKPELIAHLKYKKPPEKLTPNMMWHEDEYLSLLKLVDPVTKERDQAIIMMVWDFAAEKSCIENAKIGDVYEEDSKLMIKLTGKRRGNIREFVEECICSAPYIRRWLNVHPFGDQKDKPLFIQLHPRSYGKPIHDQFVWRLIKKVQKRSGIEKPLYPMLIRHSRCTDLAEKGVEKQLIY